MTICHEASKKGAQSNGGATLPVERLWSENQNFHGKRYMLTCRNPAEAYDTGLVNHLLKIPASADGNLILEIEIVAHSPGKMHELWRGNYARMGALLCRRKRIALPVYRGAV